MLFELLDYGTLLGCNGEAGSNNFGQKRKELAVAQNSLSKNTTRMHERNKSWWRGCLDLKWRDMDNDEIEKRESLRLLDGAHWKAQHNFE